MTRCMICRAALVTAAVTLLLAGCEEPVIPSSYEPTPELPQQQEDDPPEHPQPKPDPAPLPVVSFAGTPAGPGYLRTDIWDTVDTIIMTISLVPPPPEPIEINLMPDWPELYDHPQMVTAQAGSSEVSFAVTIHHKDIATSVRLLPGRGYVLGDVVNHDFQVWPTPEPNVQDPRCTHPTRLLLLDKVSSRGVMCATGVGTISQDALDEVSIASSMILLHRPDLAARLVDDEMDSTLPIQVQLYQNETTFILLYSDGNHWCEGLPSSYREWVCNSLTFAGGGIYAGVVVVCPDNDMAVCVHEIAHAVQGALAMDPSEDYTEYDTIISRFNDPDVRTLWSGYALEDNAEFFAEMSAMYFYTPTGQTFPALVGALALREYDPRTYQVIHAIYRGARDLRKAYQPGSCSPKNTEAPSAISMGVVNVEANDGAAFTEYQRRCDSLQKNSPGRGARRNDDQGR